MTILTQFINWLTKEEEEKKREYLQNLINENKIGTIKELLTGNEFSPEQLGSAFYYAATIDKTEMAMTLIEQIDPSYHNNYAIKWATKKGNAELVGKLLTDTRVNPAANNNAAIKIAANQGNIEIVRILLSDTRVDPCDQDCEALKCAAEQGHMMVCLLLLISQPIDKQQSMLEAIKEFTNIDLLQATLKDLNSIKEKAFDLIVNITKVAEQQTIEKKKYLQEILNKPPASTADKLFIDITSTRISVR